MTSEPVMLPPATAEPSRPPLPFIAALVPVVAGVVMWIVTGSLLSLCFALLGPLMIAGSAVDGARRRRKEGRTAVARTAAAWAAVEEETGERRAREREALWRLNPDAARWLSGDLLREDRAVDASTPIVVGTGERESTIRMSGGEGERAKSFRREMRVLDAAPIVVPLGRGVCVRAPGVVGAAIARAFVAQLCLRHVPGRLALVGDLPEPWMFPHAFSAPKGAWRLGVSFGADPVSGADSILWIRGPEDPVPDGVTTVIDCHSPAEAELRTADGVQLIAAECLSEAQLRALVAGQVDTAPAAPRLPERLMLSTLPPLVRPGTLTAVIGAGAEGPCVVDLVGDGPHAMVTGMTGSGKSELLVTWVTAIASAHPPADVQFVLADFKGGTAFDALSGLAHVSAVLTDLDDAGARRGVQSLTAELRRRERVLAEASARDISEVRMPRLVIVVDEFAALLHEHPDLAAVFTDIAARGRALGMHLILGTQRAAGVIRDALAANCPLRISLRVADAADSRMVIGSVDAAELEGGQASRGIAYVRRPQDVAAGAVRVALTGPEELRACAVCWPQTERAAGPWLPPLESSIPLTEFEPRDGELILGRADEPERQRQRAVTVRVGRERGLAVVGGPGAGKSTVLRALAQQHPDAIVIPSDLEDAWDAITALTPGQGPQLVLGDDVDRLLAAVPHEHATALAERLERFIRGADDATVVLTASKVGGVSARLIDALPERMLLRLPTRGDHLAAGGDGADFVRDRPPGRARLAGTEMQVAWVPPMAEARVRPIHDPWHPERQWSGVVAPAGARVIQLMRTAFPLQHVCAVGEAPEDAGAGLVLVGDGEAWQRDWARLRTVRAEGEMVVTAECATELRTLLGVRELPPYARTHAGRGWRIRDGLPPERVLLPWPERALR